MKLIKPIRLVSGCVLTERMVVGYNQFSNLWQVFDRGLMIVRSHHTTRERAEHTALQLELFDEQQEAKWRNLIRRTEN